MLRALANSALLKNTRSYVVNNAQIYTPGHAQHMEHDATAYTEEGYKKNVIVYRCIEIIAESISSIPLIVTRDDKPLPDHPLQKLLDKPNLNQSRNEWIEELTAFNLITGTSFCEAITSMSGKDVYELWNWQPYQMTAIKTSAISFVPRAWEWKYGAHRRIWEVDPITGESNLFVNKRFNPTDQFFGMSPIQAAAYSVDQHNAGGEWNTRMLQNDMSPSGVLTSEKRLDETQYQRLKSDIEEQYSGSQNAKKPLLLEGGLTWQQMALSAKEMDFINGLNMSAQQIAAAFGVPLQVIPLPGSQTFANYAEARLALWEDTVIPSAENLANALIKFLSKYYKDGESLKIKLDLDEIPALASRRKEKFETANTTEFMTINEKRAFVGMEELAVEGADEIWMPGGLLPLSDMMDEDAGAEEEHVHDEEEEEDVADNNTSSDTNADSDNNSDDNAG